MKALITLATALLMTLPTLAAAAGAGVAALQGARARAIAAVFDDAVAAAGTPTSQVAAMSELLRRAARRVDPQADRLQGEAWLQFLGFDDSTGWLLLDGGYRREIEPRQVDALRPLARARFLQWSTSRRRAGR